MSISGDKNGKRSSKETASRGWGLVLACWCCVVGLCFFSNVRDVWAQDTNYQDFILGQRAMGMGGAFTALADDPSAAFYNPAGFAQARRLRLGLSLTLYSLEFRENTEGLKRPDGTTNLDALYFSIIPATTGIAVEFGPRDETGRREWGAGITFMIPSRSAIYFREGFETAGGSSLYLLYRFDQTFWAGPSIAKRWGRLSVGISGLYVHRSFSWLLTQSGTSPRCPTTDVCDARQLDGLVSSVEGWVGNLTFRLGVLYEINDKWRVGGMLGLSSLRLWGEGSLLLHRYLMSRDGGGNGSSQYINQRGLKTNSVLPWEGRIGAAYQHSDRFLLSFDVALYLPVSFDLLKVTSETGVKDEDLDIFQYPRQIKREFTFNFYVGIQYLITKSVPFRLGLFTNLSSSPGEIFTEACKTRACLPKLHMFGLTTSLGINIGQHALDVGFNGSFGQGTDQRIVNGAGLKFENVTRRQLFMYFYISGLTRILGFGVETIIKQIAKIPILRIPPEKSKAGSKKKRKPKVRARRPLPKRPTSVTPRKVNSPRGRPKVRERKPAPRIRPKERERKSEQEIEKWDTPPKPKTPPKGSGNE